MKLDRGTIRRLAADKGLSLSELLRLGGVSRTAFYSLARRSTVLPKSIHALAHSLGVRPSEILDDKQSPVEEQAVVRLREARKILAAHPDASFENLWHTLSLLELSHEDRLNRSLIRGRSAAVHR